MNERAGLQTLGVLILVGTLTFAAAWFFPAPRESDWILQQAIASGLFASSAAAIFFRLRVCYPPLVSVTAVLALLSMPTVFSCAIHESLYELVSMALTLSAWGYWPIARRSYAGAAAWGMITTGAVLLIPINLGISAELACQVPEWHWVFALLGVFTTIKQRRHDPVGFYMLLSALPLIFFVQAPAKLALFAPLIGLGVGKTLYRGTLTKSFRIPPATWAVIFLTIASVRSVVIMTTHAPHWALYTNRIGMYFER